MMTGQMFARETALGWLGCAAGPVCWYAHEQLSLWLMPITCDQRRWVPLALWPILALVLVVAGVGSWRARRRLPSLQAHAGRAEQRAVFVTFTGTIMPLIFLLVVMWQGIAGLVYSGCER